MTSKQRHLTKLALSLALHDADAPHCEWTVLKKEAVEFATNSTARKEIKRITKAPRL